jgi:hypothetical protein
VRILGDLADRAFILEPVAVRDWLRIAELVARATTAERPR